MKRDLYETIAVRNGKVCVKIQKSFDGKYVAQVLHVEFNGKRSTVFWCPFWSYDNAFDMARKVCDEYLMKIGER